MMVLETAIFYGLGAAIVALGGGISAGLKSELKNREATRALITMSRKRRASLSMSAKLHDSPDTITAFDPAADESDKSARLARYGLILAKTRSLDTIPTISVAITVAMMIGWSAIGWCVVDWCAG